MRASHFFPWRHLKGCLPNNIIATEYWVYMSLISPIEIWLSTRRGFAVQRARSVCQSYLNRTSLWCDLRLFCYYILLKNLVNRGLGTWLLFILQSWGGGDLLCGPYWGCAAPKGHGRIQTVWLIGYGSSLGDWLTGYKNLNSSQP